MSCSHFRRVLSVFIVFAMMFTSLPMLAGDMDAYAASTSRPAKVKKLTVSLTASNTVKLKWTKAKKKPAGYAIYRNGKLIKRVGKSKKTFVDKTVKPGVKYKYYVKAYRTYKAKRWYNKETGKYQKKKPAKAIRGKRKKVKLYKYGKKSPTRSITTPAASNDTPAADPAPGFTYATGSDGGITLTSYSGKDANPVIPSEIGGKKVTAIGDSCFAGNTKIRNITIPDTVVSIGDYAFECCGAMTSVKFSSMLKSIGKGAFSGCGQIASLDIPDSVKTIDDGAFLYCKSCKELKISAGLTTLGQFAFAGMESLERASFKGSALTQLPDRAFCNCLALTDIKLPSGLASIGKRAFSNCQSLAELEFTDKLNSVGDYAFEKDESLQSITFTASDLHLGSKVFYYNNADRTKGCTLTMPHSATCAEDAFDRGFIKNVIFSTEDAGSEVYIEDHGLYSGEGSGKTLLLAFCEGGEFTVSEGTAKIADGAFYGVDFRNVALPDSLTETADEAFYGGIIRKITLGAANENDAFLIGGDENTGYSLYKKIEGADNAALEADDSTGAGSGDDSEVVDNAGADDEAAPYNGKLELLRYFRPTYTSSKSYTYTLPENVTRIAPFAFCFSGQGVTIEVGAKDTMSLSEMAAYAFYDSGITLPEDDTSEMYGHINFDPSWTKDDIDQITDPKAFEKADNFYNSEMDDVDTSDDPGADDPLDPDDTGDWPYDESDGYNRLGEDRSDEELPIPEDAEPVYTSFDGGKSLFSPEKFTGFKDIHKEFSSWTDKYIDYNNGPEELSPSLYLYTMLYKGDDHYRTMACVLNGDQYKHKYSVENIGDDYHDMYLMMDHGLFTELSRPKTPDDLILYSGITPERTAIIAGLDKSTASVSPEEMTRAIGSEYVDAAMMSTTASINIAVSFSGTSNTIVMIYASKAALDELGAVDIESMSSMYSHEEEILFSDRARFKVLDAGTMTVGEESRNCIKLELLGKAK